MTLTSGVRANIFRRHRLVVTTLTDASFWPAGGHLVNLAAKVLDEADAPIECRMVRKQDTWTLGQALIAVKRSHPRIAYRRHVGGLVQAIPLLGGLA